MTKRLTALAVLITALMAFTPGHAATFSATIIAPTGSQGTEGNCLPNAAGCEKAAVARHARCAYLANSGAAQDATTGKVGYVLNVSAVAGRPFTLKPATGNTGDFDVTFYISLGTCEGATPRGNPTGGADPAPASDDAEYDNFSHHLFGNETGTIPTRATRAIVTLFGGANSKFSLVTT